MIDLRPHFPDAVLLREHAGDVVLADREIAPHCGFMSMKETEILVDLATTYFGDWLEIGSHVGWSAAHIAAAHPKNTVAAVDIEYTADAKSGARHRAFDNWARCGLLGRVQGIGSTSKAFLDRVREYVDVQRIQNRFAGAFIDGNHDAPEPLNDAKGVLPLMDDVMSVVVFHDYHGQPIKDAVEWVRAQGFTITIHETINGLAVCERIPF